MPSRVQKSTDKAKGKAPKEAPRKKPAPPEKSTYKASTYAASAFWLEESRVQYAANPKSGKSFERYAGYEKAGTIGESLRLGSLPADLLFDYEKGHLEVSGPLRDKPLDLFTMEGVDELTYTDKVLARYLCYAQTRGDQAGADKIQVLEESLRKQRANMRRLQKVELAKHLEIKDVDSIADSVGFWETPTMMARRSMAAAQAKDIMAAADETGRNITEYEILQVLRLWDFRENQTRKNVMKEGETFVYSDTVGLVADRTGKILAKEETRRYPHFGQLLCRWLRERIDRKQLGTEFVFTSININKNYAGKLHRDGNNVGPSFLKAFGKFTGGQLNYFPEDDRSLKLTDLEAMADKSEKIDVAKGLLLFDGKRGHFVDDFDGERYSLVFFTCPRFEKITEETRQVLDTAGFPIPTQATMAKVMNLLRKPQGYDETKAPKREDKKGKRSSSHDAPFIYNPLCTPERVTAEACAEKFWKRRGLRAVNMQATAQRTTWEHCKHHREAQWLASSFVQLPGEPARKDLILEGHKNMVDAVAFLNTKAAKAPKTVAKEGCCAIFSSRTRVWYALYARGRRSEALAAFGVEANGVRQTCAKVPAMQGTPSKRPSAGEPKAGVESSKKQRRT